MQTESSVVFNLAEIMQLEHERVTAERAAEQAAHAAVEHAQRERLERERRELERAQQVQARLRLRAARRAERQQQERAAALLRVRLDAEARVRLQQDALELERLRVEQAQRRGYRWRRWQGGALSVGLAVLVATGTAAWLHVQHGEAELRAVRATEREAHARGVAAAQESARLRAQLDALRAAQASAPTLSSPHPRAEPNAVAKPPGSGTRNRPHGAAGTASRPPRTAPAPLGGLDGYGDDPIGGLLDPLRDDL